METRVPLAERMRPTSFDEFVGQQHIVGKNTLLYRAIKGSFKLQRLNDHLSQPTPVSEANSHLRYSPQEDTQVGSKKRIHFSILHLHRIVK